MSIEDRDQGYSRIVAEFKKLDGKVVLAGIQASEPEEMRIIAAVHEFGATMIITRKQAIFMARHLMGMDLQADDTNDTKRHFWAVVRKLTGRKLVIPERSYLRSTFDEKIAALERASAQVLERIEAGQTTQEALAWFGQGVVTLIQRRIRAGIGPDNAPMTIAQKRGENTPLINHGRFVNSIRYVVQSKGAPGADG